MDKKNKAQRAFDRAQEAVVKAEARAAKCRTELQLAIKSEQEASTRAAQALFESSIVSIERINLGPFSTPDFWISWAFLDALARSWESPRNMFRGL